MNIFILFLTYLPLVRLQVFMHMTCSVGPVLETHVQPGEGFPAHVKFCHLPSTAQRTLLYVPEE